MRFAVLGAAFAILGTSFACGEPDVERGALVAREVRPVPPPPDDRSPGPLPTRPPFLPSAAPGQRALWFETEDDAALVGRLFGDDRRRAHGVLLLHPTSSDMSAWFPLAERLQDRGYMVLTFDFRGFGQSEPPRDASAMPTDVATGVEILTLYGADRIAVVGSGAGGTAAVGTDLPGTVLGVAALAAAPTFDDLDAREQAGKLEAKTLVLDPPEGGGAAIAEIVPDAQLERIDAGPTPESDERVTSLLERFIEQTIGKP